MFILIVGQDYRSCFYGDFEKKTFELIGIFNFYFGPNQIFEFCFLKWIEKQKSVLLNNEMKKNYFRQIIWYESYQCWIKMMIRLFGLDQKVKIKQIIIQIFYLIIFNTVKRHLKIMLNRPKMIKCYHYPTLFDIIGHYLIFKFWYWNQSADLVWPY